MNSFVLPLLMGMGGQGGGEGAGGANFLTSMLPFAAIIAIFYFLIIRPQSKKRKDTEKMLSSVKKGDRVVTIGGIHGTVQNVRDTTVIIKVDDGVKLEFNRGAIASVQPVLIVREEKEEKAEKEEKVEKEEKSEEKEGSSEAENTQK